MRAAAEKTSADIRVESLLLLHAADAYGVPPAPTQITCSDCGCLFPSFEATITTRDGKPYVQCPDRGKC